MPKIVQFNLPPGGTVVELADNTSEALDIESAGPDAKDYITIDTTDGGEIVKIQAGTGPGLFFEASRVRAGAGGQPGFQLEDASATNPTVLPNYQDADTGIGWAEANQLSLVAGGTEAVQLRSGPEVHLGDYANDAGSNALVFKKSRSATTGTAAIVEDNDVLGLIEFQGADSAGTADSNFATGAKIFARVNGTPGDGDMPTELVFAMSKDNSETPVETLRIMPTATANKAQVTIGTDSYASAYTYSPIAVDAETQNGPVFERTSNGNAMVFQFNTKNCIAGSNHPIALMPGGTERLEIGTNGVCKLAASSAIQYNSGVGTDTATTEPVYLADTNGTMVIDFNKGNFGDITLAANVTAVKFFNAPADGTTATITAKITQDSSVRTFDYSDSAVTVYSDYGSTAVTGEIKFAGGAHHVQSTGSGAVDLVSFTCIPSGSAFNVYAKVIGQAFA